MANKQLKKNIEALDIKIAKLYEELETANTDQYYDKIITRIEKLTEVRNKLTHDKVSDSHMKEILSGVLGIGGMALVLYHERANVITTKAFSMATKMFRG